MREAALTMQENQILKRGGRAEVTENGRIANSDRLAFLAFVAVDSASAGFYSSLVFWPSNGRATCCYMCSPPCG
jgi:hypothetical protein